MSSMYVFTPKCEVQLVMFYKMCKTRIGGRSFIDNRQTKLSSIYGYKPIFSLIKPKRCYIQIYPTFFFCVVEKLL